jgi:hypothetical protein
MIKRIISILIGVFVGLVILTGVIWILSKTLGDSQSPTLYAGNTIEYWQQQLNGKDVGASNAAFAVVNSQVIPQLVDTMFHDTNDSSLRLSLIKILNGLPGIQIYHTEAGDRRATAVSCIGEFGPAAKTAIPALMQALKGKDLAIHEVAITVLGNIHSQPDVVIPLLISYLDDDDLNDEAATALGNFGSLAKPAIPKILPLLHAADDDAQAAAKETLLKIDSAAAAKAGVKTDSPESSK